MNRIARATIVSGLLSGLAASAAFGQCLSTPPVVWPVNGHKYLSICAPLSTFAEANAAAQAVGEGCHLATIHSNEENAFIDSLANLTEDAWIGGTQPAGQATPSAGWGWVTGEPFSYDNWASGEPNDSDDSENGDQDCMQFYQSAEWDDLGCGDERNQLVVECPPLSVADIPTLSPWGGSLLAAFVLLAALYALRSLHRRSTS